MYGVADVGPRKRIDDVHGKFTAILVFAGVWMIFRKAQTRESAMQEARANARYRCPLANPRLQFIVSRGTARLEEERSWVRHVG